MRDNFNPFDKNSKMKDMPGKDIPSQVKEQELRNALPGLWRQQPSQPRYSVPISGEEESKGQQESKGEEPKGSIKKREESPTTKFGQNHPGLLDWQASPSPEYSDEVQKKMEYLKRSFEELKQGCEEKNIEYCINTFKFWEAEMLVAFNDSVNTKNQDEYGQILTRFRRLWKKIVNENPELKKIMKKREKGYEDSLRHFNATQRRKKFLEKRRKKARRSTIRGETARRNRISKRTKILTDGDFQQVDRDEASQRRQEFLNERIRKAKTMSRLRKTSQKTSRKASGKIKKRKKSKAVQSKSQKGRPIRTRPRRSRARRTRRRSASH